MRDRTSALLAQDPSARRATSPFWREKTLDEMSSAEWESLCDGCGRCCLLKLEDDDTGEVYHTDVGCTLLDGLTCNCRDYVNRQRRVPDCVRLTPEAVRTIPWLPPTCAYRLVRDGQDLYPWHPLVSGRQASVHEAGISVRGRISGNEEEFTTDELLDQIVTWPGRTPETEDED
ncbi:YcgN family cysteine cluster protein [Methylobacterium sp. E-045]|uniref:YcgN family cysteine cluster protein n=1 Tax=Methylobacterium sp. E-045 TaxID=2836575 RepID=UPI001FBBF32E|nr:YcgN family cysteine cluster protein [Methylobacterium sp. E-045]MCJ2130590.1 YcgN family cysteine cluster protein [Methylobacterium sp. E-045]